MQSIEVLERLSQMVLDADKEASAKVGAVARQMAAQGMLVSGNFYVAEKDALQLIYDGALKKMEVHSLSLVSPRSAASAVRSAALDLEGRLLARFEGVLSGAASGNPCPPKASDELISDFRRFLRERLLSAVSDTANNVLGKPVKGWRGWLERYCWNAINTLIAAMALYWSWGKK